MKMGIDDNLDEAYRQGWIKSYLEKPNKTIVEAKEANKQ